MDISLAGRAAIVTGGSKGIGLGIALRFARSGAAVAIVARGRDALAQAEKRISDAAGRRVVTVVADVANAGDIKRAYDETMRALGRIDIIVNNAGTSRAGPFESLTDEIMQQDLDQKFFAALRLTRLVWEQMKARRWGRIINVLNIGAKAPRGGSAPTTISRAAGMALTKVLAGEGAPHNILVNALLVGIIEADQHEQAAKRAGVPVADYLGRFAKDIPMGRVGQPEEFANLACLLASDAGSYITGTAINVDGGRSPVV
jgi:NAD(P)-dependent dehydrogenase (short-subunit alcohol dehydrogenase family)